MSKHRLVDKSYYYKHDDNSYTFYKIVKAKNTKRSSGIKDTLLDMIDYKMDYELNELVETGNAQMWYSCLKEDLKPMTHSLYKTIEKKAKELNGSKGRVRFLFKIEVQSNSDKEIKKELSKIALEF